MLEMRFTSGDVDGDGNGDGDVPLPTYVD